MAYIEKNYVPNWINVADPSRQNLENSNSGSEIRQSTWNAEGGTIPIIYGTQRVGGKIIAISGSVTIDLLTIAVVFCEGIVEEVKELAINDTEVIITNPESSSATVLDIDELPVTNISWEVYKGDQTTVSPKLAAIYANYADTLNGVCYAVITVTAGVGITHATSSFPRITATIKGKKVYDKRDANQTQGVSTTYTWSNNPSLCLADFISSNIYGLNRIVDWDSVSTCADYNDKLVASIPIPPPVNPWPPLPAATETVERWGSTWVFDIWSRTDFVDYYLNLPNVSAKYAMLWKSGAEFRNFFYSYVFLGDFSDEQVSRKDAAWRINKDLWNTRALWANPIENSLMRTDPNFYSTAEEYFAADFALGGPNIYGQYWFNDQLGGGVAAYFSGSFDFKTMAWNYQDTAGKFKRGYALLGRPIYPLDPPKDLEVSRMLDIVIDSEQATIDWVETLRGYASCFLVVDGDKYSFIPDKPVGFGFNAQGNSISYVHIDPYAEIDISGPLSLEISIKPDATSQGIQTIISKGHYDKSDFNLVYDKYASTFEFTWHNINHEIITYTIVVSPLSTTSFTTISLSLNNLGELTAYVLDESKVKLTSNNQVLDIGRNIETFTFGIYINNPLVGPLTLGAAYNAPTGSYFTGIIDEFRLWNVSRSLKEISNQITTPILEKIDNNLVCHLKFNEGTASLTKAVGEDWISTDNTKNFAHNIGLKPTLHTPDSTVSVWFQHDGLYDCYKFDGSNMVDGTFKFHRRGIMNLPTIVEFSYTLNVDYNVIKIDGSWGELRPWKEDYYRLDNSSLHGGKVRISKIPMPGITRYSQAVREAQERYNSVVSDSNVVFGALDDVLNITVGDVIQVHHPAFESSPDTIFKPYRVNSIQQKDIGRWNISAIEYDSKNYLDINPGDPSYPDTNLLPI